MSESPISQGRYHRLDEEVGLFGSMVDNCSETTVVESLCALTDEMNENSVWIGEDVRLMFGMDTGLLTPEGFISKTLATDTSFDCRVESFFPIIDYDEQEGFLHASLGVELLAISESLGGLVARVEAEDILDLQLVAPGDPFIFEKVWIDDMLARWPHESELYPDQDLDDYIMGIFQIITDKSALVGTNMEVTVCSNSDVILDSNELIPSWVVSDEDDDEIDDDAPEEGVKEVLYKGVFVAELESFSPQKSEEGGVSIALVFKLDPINGVTNDPSVKCIVIDLVDIDRVKIISGPICN